jgi:hypothetical protein
MFFIPLLFYYKGCPSIYKGQLLRNPDRLKVDHKIVRGLGGIQEFKSEPLTLFFSANHDKVEKLSTMVKSLMRGLFLYRTYLKYLLNKNSQDV